MLSPESRRTLLALSVSPAVTPVAVAGFALSRGVTIEESLVVAAVYAAFTYSGTLLLGLPAHLLLTRRGFTSVWHYATAGSVFGVLIFVGFVLMNDNVAFGLIPVLIFAAFGAVTASVFWKLSAPRTS